MRASRPLGAAAEPLVNAPASGRGGGDQPLVFARAHTVSLSHAYTGCTPTLCSARSSSAAAASRSYCSAILSVCQSSRRAGQPTGTPLGLPAACPRPSMRPPPLRAHWRRSEPTARSHSGCGSGGASAREIRASGRRARPAPWSRGGRRWKGLRRLRAALTHPAPRRRPRCARAPAQTAGPRCASPAGGTPAAMRCAGGTAAEAPETRRAGLGDSFPNLARCRQRTGGSLGRVLNVRGRPAVCKRRLVAAAHGLSNDAGGVGRLRTNGAAVWRALGQFGTAVAASGRGGRTAASGGKHICVC